MRPSFANTVAPLEKSIDLCFHNERVEHILPMNTKPHNQRAPRGTRNASVFWHLLVCIGGICSLAAIGLAVAQTQALSAATTSPTIKEPMPTPPSAPKPSSSVIPTHPSHEPVVAAVGSTMPTVVNINTLARVNRSNFWQRYRSQRVASLGSGMIVSDDGYIVTNHHVVASVPNTKIRVTLHEGTVYEANLVTSDPKLDLALIRINAQDKLPFFDLEKLSPNLLGQTVIALGNPVGYQNSVSRGILSAKNRSLETENQTISGLLQTDAAINPGNSGGPLVDIQGHLVGINSAKFAGAAIEGIGFAIPGSTVATWVKESIAVARGEKTARTDVSLLNVLRQRFGLVLLEMTPSLANRYGHPADAGMIIARVDRGSPADLAGLRQGMVVVGIGSFPIVDEDSLPQEIAGIQSGQLVTFTVVSIPSVRGYLKRIGLRIDLQAR